MIPQSVLSSKPLLISNFNQHIPPSSSMLTATMTNPTFMTYGRGLNGTEVNLIALMQNMRPEAQNLCRSLAQQLSSTPLLDLGSPAMSDLLAAPAKRNLMTPVIEVAQPPTPTNEPVKSSPQGPSSFSMTAAITSALSTNSAAAGSQLLPACSPLLQLAVRQALGECLPNFTPLHIHGSLEISFEGTTSNGTQPIQSTTVLKFSDDLRQHTSPMSQHFSPNSRPNHVSPSNSLPTNMTFGEAAHKYSVANHCTGGSSRRKSFNPTKCNLEEFHSGSVPDSHVSSSFSPAASISPVPVRHSGSITPSTDSGILDLSRNGSLAGSAPITPMKETLMEPVKSLSNDQHLLEAYQSQLAAFNQLQSLWGRSSNNFNDCRSVSVAPTGLISATNLSSGAYPVLNFSHQSGPNSPTKPVRRKAINRANSIGRMCALRRPNSNRRFPCNQCREEFPSLHTLEEHTMFQHGTYRCHICNAQFTQRSNLQRHALKHVGFKPFECRVCSKAYYRKDHLMRHMEMGHPGYTPRDNITVHLTSSESLDFLNRSCPAPVNTEVEECSNGTTVGQDVVMEIEHGNSRPNTPERELLASTTVIHAINLSPGDDDAVARDDEVDSERRDSVYSSTGAPSSVEFPERCVSSQLSVEELPVHLVRAIEESCESVV